MHSRDIVGRSAVAGTRVAAVGVALAFVVLIVGIALHMAGIAIAVTAGLAVAVVTLFGAFRARAAHKRELESPRGGSPRD
jgi:hypothetical protein